AAPSPRRRWAGGPGSATAWSPAPGRVVLLDVMIRLAGWNQLVTQQVTMPLSSPCMALRPSVTDVSEAKICCRWRSTVDSNVLYFAGAGYGTRVGYLSMLL